VGNLPIGHLSYLSPSLVPANSSLPHPAFDRASALCYHINERSFRKGHVVEEPWLTKGEQTRQEILAAAKELFLAQGYTATTMRQIARAVGITPAAIYNHFPGKDEIFTTLLQEAAPYDQLFALSRKIEADTPEGLVQQMFRGAVRLMADHQDYLRLALVDAQEREGATLATFLPQVLPYAQELYHRLVALDAAHGRLRDIPFLVFMRVQLSLIAGFLMTERIVKGAPMLQLSDTDWAHALSDIFLHGVLKRTESKGA
jgi:AcrR family transcriptional regulator